MILWSLLLICTIELKSDVMLRLYPMNNMTDKSEALDKSEI